MLFCFNVLFSVNRKRRAKNFNETIKDSGKGGKTMNASTCIRRAKKTGDRIISLKPLGGRKFRVKNGPVIKKAKTKSFRRHFENTGRLPKNNTPKVTFSFVEGGMVKTRCPYCRHLIVTENFYNEYECISCGFFSW